MSDQASPTPEEGEKGVVSRRFFMKVATGLVAFLPSAYTLFTEAPKAAAASLIPQYIICSVVFCRIWTTYCSCGVLYCVWYCIDSRTEEDCGYETEACGTC